MNELIMCLVWGALGIAIIRVVWFAVMLWDKSDK
jgi:hypothetical protein